MCSTNWILLSPIQCQCLSNLGYCSNMAVLSSLIKWAYFIRWAKHNNNKVVRRLFHPVLYCCTNWFLSSCLNCVFVPGSGRFGLPGILPKNPVRLILHPGSSDLLRLFRLLPGAGYPLCDRRGCGCVYRYTVLTYNSGTCQLRALFIRLNPVSRLIPLVPPSSISNISQVLTQICICPSCQTGTQQAMDCPPHMSVTRQAPSSPSPCSTSLPPTSLSWALEP